MKPVALITGASSGIGAETARRFAAAGHHVVAVARRAEKLEQLVTSIAAAGGDAESWPCDVTDPAACEAMIVDLQQRHGVVSVLVNNAGFGYHRRFVDTPPQVIDRMFALNVVGAMRLSQAVLPGMLARGRGSIVNVASVAGRVPHPVVVSYAASKHALVGFSMSLWLELRGTGVHVSVVCPGATRSEFWQQSPGELAVPEFIGKAATSATPVANAILRAARGAGPIVYPTTGAWFLAWTEKWLPWVSHGGNLWYRDKVLGNLRSR